MTDRTAPEAPDYNYTIKTQQEQALRKVIEEQSLSMLAMGKELQEKDIALATERRRVEKVEAEIIELQQQYDLLSENFDNLVEYKIAEQTQSLAIEIEKLKAERKDQSSTSDLVIRPEQITNGKILSYCLQIRRAGMPETEYITLVRNLNEADAREIISAGSAFWLFGDPRKDEK